MKLNSVHIRRYRAFDQRADVPLEDLTVLTGPNNLGKSTVLSALDLFFSVFQPRGSLRLWRGIRYSYSDDYPKRYEGRAGRRWPTQIGVTLDLGEDERAKISETSEDEVPSTIEILVEFAWDERTAHYRPSSQVVGIEDAETKEAIVDWLRSEVRYVYIPATRNVHDFRRGVFSEVISGAITRISRSRQRIEALERLYHDVGQEIAAVEADLVDELRQYLPTVRSLKFAVDDLDLNRLVSIGDVTIDDGANTPLQQKGDGFKSLFSISLLQYISKQRYGSNLLFGIEEPEAHLHSSAIYEIKDTLRDLAQSFQVIITTHSPILIQRDQISSNIIVQSVDHEDFSSSARPARTLAEIRRSLGIRPQENMTTAEVVVVVEGLTEERTFPQLLALATRELRDPIASGRVRVLGTGGASSTMSVVRALARDAASCVVFLDSDEEGLMASEKIRSSGLLQPSDVYRVAGREGCKETEFEDLFSFNVYEQELNAALGLAVTEADFVEAQRRSGGRATRCAKWSDVMAAIADSRGLEWAAISDSAKAACANGIMRTVQNEELPRPDWLMGLADRVSRYLREERAA